MAGLQERVSSMSTDMSSDSSDGEELRRHGCEGNKSATERRELKNPDVVSCSGERSDCKGCGSTVQVTKGR